MAKNYDTPLDQMKAISWQLKRIADELEILNNNFKQDKPSISDRLHKTHTIHNSTLRDFLNNIDD